MTTTRRLTVNKITSIGAVGEGDNPESRILLFKSKAADSDDHQGVPNMDTEKADLQKQVSDLTAEVERLTALVPDEEAEEIVELDAAIQKQLDEKDAALAKAKADADALTVELEKERDEKITAAITKNADEFKDVLGDDDDVVPMLKAIHGTDAYDWLIEKIKHVNAVLETADLFKELGVVDEADPAAKIEALAKEKQADNPSLTPAQARTLVRQERPELRDAERQGA